MNELFANEDQLSAMAQALLHTNDFASEKDRENYQELLDGYKTLLKQMKRVVKLSDLMQLELKNLYERLEMLSRIDPHTEIYNKRFFNEAYPKEWKSSIRMNTPLALLMIDIDFFKKYNDLFGHFKGDECLKSVAIGIKNSLLRPRDIAARFGGEEFIVILPETGKEGAAYIAQRILNNIRSLSIEHPDSESNGIVTVSIGAAATYPEEDVSMELLLKHADQALYIAKRSGRNCFCEDDSLWIAED
jgi:diguanylate cyclase (GGDEF)-like protein